MPLSNSDSIVTDNNRQPLNSNIPLIMETNNILQQQIADFKEATGIQLEVRDGKPYYNGILDMSYSKIRELPEGLSVDGGLWLYNSKIERLPEGLKVIGTLDLASTPIKELPKGLSVEGDLWLNDTKIERLPEGLKVEWTLDLSNTPIKEIQKGLSIEGGLLLDYSKIERLPEDFSVGGTLSLSSTPIKELPKGLSIEGELYLSNTSIKKLPADIKVKGNIYMNDRIIEATTDNLTPDGYIDLQKAGAPIAQTISSPSADKEQATAQQTASPSQQKTAMPSQQNDLLQQIADFKEATGIQLEIRDGKPYYSGNLELAHTNIERLPDNLTIKGDLNLFSTPIKELPEGLKVSGHLILGNSKIETLPEGLTINRNLSLADTPIKELPNDLKVKGNLFLDDSHIERLPDNLTVGLSLDLSNTPIKELPKNLTVGDVLWIADTNIKELPDDLKVKGEIVMNEKNIKATPDNLTPDGYIDLVKAGAPIAQTFSSPSADKELTTAQQTASPSQKETAVPSTTQSQNTKNNITMKSEDILQQQIADFKEATGIQLEVRDGKPYYDGDLDLKRTNIERLPEGLKVGGSLDLSYTPIQELPKGFKVEGSLNLTNTPIEKLSDDLYVGENLDLSDTRIKELPEGLNVRGDLWLYSSKIEKLPEELTVGGSLILSLTPIKELPEGLSVGKNLLLNITPIEKIPDNLTVNGDLDLSYTKIKELPENLFVDGDLWLKELQIERLPKNLTVNGDLDLSYTEIKELPNNLTVGGQLNLFNTPIKELPEGLSVGGNLILTDTKIEKLPEDLGFKGNLDLAGTPIKELPEGLTVNGGLYMHNTPIETLPHGLTVKGNLDISNTNIQELPDDLTVKGGMGLNNTLVEKLPKGLTVEGTLDLRESAITELPDNLTVRDNLFLNNTKIQQLPNNLTVGDGLYLDGTAIETLPADLKVKKGIYMNNTIYTDDMNSYGKGDGIEAPREKDPDEYIDLIKAGAPIAQTINSPSRDKEQAAQQQETVNQLTPKQKLEAIGYPYLQQKSEDGSLNIPTVHESLYWRYAAGIISLHDAAREFTSHGWTNFVDEDYTRKQFAELNQKWHKLDDDLLPLTPEQMALQKTEQQIFAKSDIMTPDGYLDLEKAILKEKNEQEDIWHKLSALLMDTSEDVHLKAKEDDILVLETNEDVGMSDLEKYHLTEVWQHPTEGIITFKIKGSNEELDLSEYPEFIPQIYNHVLEGNMETISVKQQLDNQLISNSEMTAQTKDTNQKADSPSIEDSTTAKEYAIMWMSSLAENTPKDRPSDIIFVKDFSLEDTTKPIYTAYGKDADRLAEKVSSSVTAMRPEIEGKRYPYADINSGNLDTVRADLMLKNVHPIIIDVEGKRVTDDKTLDYTKEERKAFLDSLKPEARQLASISETLQRLGNPQSVLIPQTAEHPSANPSLFIKHQFGYQEVALAEIKLSKDGSYYKAGNDEEGFIKISKLDTNNLSVIDHALKKAEKLLPQNLVNELLNQVKAGKAEVEPHIADGRYIITINDPEGRNGAYERGFKSFTVGKDLNDEILLLNDWNNRSRIIKVDPQMAQQLVSYAETKLGIQNQEATQTNADVKRFAVVREPDNSGGYDHHIYTEKKAEEIAKRDFHYIEWRGTINDLIKEADKVSFNNHKEPFHEKAYDTKVTLAELALNAGIIVKNENAVKMTENPKKDINNDITESQQTISPKTERNATESNHHEHSVDPKRTGQNQPSIQHQIEDFHIRNVKGDWRLNATIDGKKMPETSIGKQDVADYKHGKMSQQDLALKTFGDQLTNENTQSLSRGKGR